MKIKKLISSALVFVMLFTTMVTVFPIASSAEDATVEKSVKPAEEIEGEVIQAICDDYRRYGSKFTDKDGQVVLPFANARELLDYEISKGYIDYVKYGKGAVYVNRYTGLMYYENVVTGQILTSNPYDPAYQTKEGGQYVRLDYDKLSQIELQYFEAANTSVTGNYNTLYWIYENAMAPTVTETEDGIAIEYTIGSALESFVAPGAMLYESALEVLIRPMFAMLADVMDTEMGAFNAAYANGSSKTLTSYDVEAHLSNGAELGLGNHYRTSEITDVIDAMHKYAQGYDKANGTSVASKILIYTTQIKNFFNQYKFVDPAIFSDNKALADTVTAFGEGNVVMVLKGADTGDATLTTVRIVDKALKTVCQSFTMDEVAAYEEECGYTASGIDIPYFNVTIIYSIDDNGDLIVSIPANLIEYPREFCSLRNITPLKYFGAGDMDQDGYVFFPDGSGAVVEFDDFYFGSTSDKTNMAITLGNGIPMYGSDYCYAKITGAHREQLAMPVYGIVNDANSTGNGYSSGLSDVTNGFFAVIEEGSALASLTYVSGGGTHKYISAYSSFAPFPTDTYDLSQSIYTIATEARFTGTLKTRYTSLVDHAVYEKAVAADPSFDGYVADYVGMATCYRSYLEGNGVISRIAESDILTDLPLYIEALGSIDITKKILSFPVTVSEALTSFEDVEEMYEDFSNAIETLGEKAAECDEEVAEIMKDEHYELRQDEIDRLEALAEKYRALAKEVQDIKNINFKLTGFANGGLHSTYPAKLKWERSVGGKSGFRTLIENAAAASAEEDSNFGVYPDFDFMYISNTAAFDGVGRRGTAACMVDNRYASKQSYDSVKQEFESLFALVVSSGSLDKLYTKFDKKYSSYGNDKLSVSTLGSDLNSNFDKKNALTREESLNNVAALLEKMSSSYSLMGEKGNVYTIEYFDHILKAPIDSSHYNVISYTVPFYGMVFHGYLNYTGTPLNYSGSPEYEILRSIENGASLYYILCMENTNYLKEDPILSDYYGVDYNNWFEKIVAQYKTVNSAIGNLQDYRIVDHASVIAERVIDEEEMSENYRKLIEEFEEILADEISKNIDLAVKSMRDENMRDENKTGGVKFVVSDSDFNEILAVFADRVNLSVETLCDEYKLDETVKAIIDVYAAQYNGSVEVTLKADEVNDYRSKYAYITDSGMSDEDYVFTDFTCDNGNVVMVTYEKEVNGEKETVLFLLNYNIYSVKVKLDGIASEKFEDMCDENGYITLEAYEFKKG